MILRHSEPRHTHGDYAALDDPDRHQLIGGRLVKEPAPTIYHQRISGNLFLSMASHVRARGLGEVFAAPVDVRLGDYDTYQPDILFVSAAHAAIIGDRTIDGAPDLIVEVLSPSNAYYDLRHKKHVYHESGVEEYWIVDPIEQVVEIYELPRNVHVPVRSATIGERVESAVIEGFAIDIVEVFAPVGGNATDSADAGKRDGSPRGGTATGS